MSSGIGGMDGGVVQVGQVCLVKWLVSWVTKNHFVWDFGAVAKDVTECMCKLF